MFKQQIWNYEKFHNYTNAYGDQHPIAVGESKINLNFTEGGTSDRTYKVLAAKGFLLTQPWPGIENDFKIGCKITFTRSNEIVEIHPDSLVVPDTYILKIQQDDYETIEKTICIDPAETLYLLRETLQKKED